MTTFSSAHQELLDQPRFAVVATVGQDHLPHQTVMWYLRDGGELLLSTPEGSLKHRHLAADPRLSVCVEDAFRYVTVSGRVTVEDHGPEAARQLYRRIGARYLTASTPLPGPPGDRRTAELLSRDRVSLRLHVDHVHSSGLP